MRALILVDLQNDFMPGGALAVPGGDEVMPVANRLMGRFELVLASQDWHPVDHGSFAANHPGKRPGDRIELNGLDQILWPVHCVRETSGAEFHAELDCSRIDRVFRKGTDPGIDSYSAFFDNAQRRSTGLGRFLKQRGVRQVHVMGLATDYCVRFTALDAVRLGFETHLVVDGCRGVELQAGDVELALAELERAGVRRVPSEDL